MHSVSPAGVHLFTGYSRHYCTSIINTTVLYCCYTGATTHLHGPAIRRFCTKNVHDVVLKGSHYIEAVFLCHGSPEDTEKPSIDGPHKMGDAEMIKFAGHKRRRLRYEYEYESTRVREQTMLLCCCNIVSRFGLHHSRN